MTSGNTVYLHFPFKQQITSPGKLNASSGDSIMQCYLFAKHSAIKSIHLPALIVATMDS